MAVGSAYELRGKLDIIAENTLIRKVQSLCVGMIGMISGVVSH